MTERSVGRDVSGWEWRNGHDVADHTSDEFHAFTRVHNLACTPGLFWVGTWTEPTEASNYCGDCGEVVRAVPPDEFVERWDAEPDDVDPQEFIGELLMGRNP